MRPLVSFITPAFNAEKYIEAYLKSLLAQDYPQVQIIIVNDGSTDKTEAIILAYREKLLQKGYQFQYHYQSNQGQSCAFNAALALVAGEYLAWADADDWLHPENISAKVEYLENHQGFGMVRCNGRVYDLDNKVSLPDLAKPEDKSPHHVFEKIFSGESYCHAGCYMIRMSLFRQIYPELKIPESREGQNFQLLLPAASRTICGYIDRVLFTYNVHRDSHSHHLRSYTDFVRRLGEFKKLRIELIAYCTCDREYYGNLAVKLYEKEYENFSRHYALQQRRELLYTRRQRIIAEKRKDLKNKNFTLLCNKCVGGAILHELAQPFLTPTIKLGIDPENFVIYLKYLKQFQAGQLIEDKNSKCSFPVGILQAGEKNIPPVTIQFNHYTTFQEAQEKWYERSKRINFDNLYVMMFYGKSTMQKDVIRQFDQLAYKNKVVFMKEKLDDISSSYALSAYCKDPQVEDLHDYVGTSGRTYYDEFDYVKFLNS